MILYGRQVVGEGGYKIRLYFVAMRFLKLAKFQKLETEWTPVKPETIQQNINTGNWCVPVLTYVDRDGIIHVAVAITTAYHKYK